ncbi:hypothetical protein [Cyclobacterium marinum]|uniref:hypothetical protein n=1 Tax=Cyclobacterium marinum TaxID=104 RepID=UPI0011EDD3E1|nr:hypothetical protein [Cyclobacterium marinum]MBI0397991.1 hypothetical protein [Cyclobacterium marinum]
MNTDRERFELLESLWVSREVQQLFSEVLREDEKGRLIADYLNEHGDVVDHEVLAVLKHKLSSRGILYFSPAEPVNVRTLYISDGLMPLIFLVQRKMGRVNFTYSAFLAIGAKMDKRLILKGVEQYPKGVKIYTVFDHSLLSRIRDCKVQHWLKGEDCLFKIANNRVVASFKGKDFRMPVGEFSLRNHCRQVGQRQTVSTCKPFDKNIDNFYLFYYF